ncbi:Ion transport protein-domain-containing protein [Dunaliella salina]|uniref:Ion transport protein-domain-containing protein n=1 Tax=Dunaliella salina TaxID=3046 RepID=A0ABQ7GAE9_DUNSA|nr:Ion transport protein-domain-containing protein [Dunaliella salina]|eukprot:KAF5831584.1 Ion transport protein-domain-containing protein [Dunaliella salina]
MDGTKNAQEVFTRAWQTALAWCRGICTPPRMESLEQVYCDKALGFIPKRCWVRKQLLLLTHTRIFELVVLMAIAANCVTLALDSNAPGFRESTMGRRLQLADYVFTGFFSVEMVLKVVAMGLVAAPNTYLRSGWNLLDVAIICTGYISLAGFANVTALRGIRALRPLRTITRIKKMKVVVSSLVASMPALLDVSMVMALYFAIFGTMCVLLFGGALSHRCADPDFSHAYTDASGFVQGVQYVVPDADKGDVCKNTRVQDVRWRNTTDASTRQIELTPTHTKTSVNGWAFDCDFHPSEDHPYGQFCAPFKNPGAGGFPDYVPGYNSFDNILESWVAVFQHVTATDWAFVMYEVQDGVNWWTWILHFFMNFMGAMLLINLITAVIFMNYQKDMAGDDKDNEDPEMTALRLGGDKPGSAGGHPAGRGGFMEPQEPFLYGSPELPAPSSPQDSKGSVTMEQSMIGEQSELASPASAKQNGEDLSPSVVVVAADGSWQQQPARRASLLMPVREEAEGAGTLAAADGDTSHRESAEGCRTHHHLTPLTHPKKHKSQPPACRPSAEMVQPVNDHHQQHLQNTHSRDALTQRQTSANGHHHHQHLQHTHSRDLLAQRQAFAASGKDLDSACHRTAMRDDSVLDANSSTKEGASTKSTGGSAYGGMAKGSKEGAGEGGSDVTLPEFPPIETVSEEEEEEQKKERDSIMRRGSSVAYPSPSFFGNKLGWAEYACDVSHAHAQAGELYVRAQIRCALWLMSDGDVLLVS